VKNLAVIVSGGTFNNLIQVLTLLTAAAASGMAVRVFFRDEAVLKVTRTGACDVNLSETYRGREHGVVKRLAAQGLTSLPAQFEGLRRLGDVKLYACSSSMAIAGVGPDDLLDGIAVRGVTAFLLEDVAVADRVLTF
jgi:peroxiredoxin family protein